MTNILTFLKKKIYIYCYVRALEQESKKEEHGRRTTFRWFDFLLFVFGSVIQIFKTRNCFVLRSYRKSPNLCLTTYLFYARRADLFCSYMKYLCKYNIYRTFVECGIRFRKILFTLQPVSVYLITCGVGGTTKCGTNANCRSFSRRARDLSGINARFSGGEQRGSCSPVAMRLYGDSHPRNECKCGVAAG